MADETFGEITGIDVGQLFDNRAGLRAALIHRPSEAGICGSEKVGAESIVVSGGYEDDEDFGEEIVYTGHGGRDDRGQHDHDQKLTRGNLALAKSCDEGLPVRVVRGFKGDPAHSPESGFRYDGLYGVDEYWQERGNHGYLVWRYRLVRLSESVPEFSLGAKPGPAPSGNSVPGSKKGSTRRVIRFSAVAQWVKQVHKHGCQVCRIVVTTSAGPYAEGAHIKPLGRPHNGPDTVENVLCLCPNCHVRFDGGALVISNDLTICDRIDGALDGPLATRKEHNLDLSFIAYHRTLFE